MVQPNQSTDQTVNGVDVHALQETITAIKNAPDLGEFRFRAHNQWQGGPKNQTEIKDFYGAGKEDDTRSRPFVMPCDEPRVLLGKDEAPNPAEHLLSALAGCVTTTMAMHAAARGIQIDSIRSDLEGDIDVRGFLGLSNDVPRGYEKIRVTMHVKSKSSPDKLRELAEYSPIFNTITHAVPVEVNIVMDP